jgi:hypothetical protein
MNARIQKGSRNRVLEGCLGDNMLRLYTRVKLDVQDSHNSQYLP